MRPAAKHSSLYAQILNLGDNVTDSSQGHAGNNLRKLLYLVLGVSGPFLIIAIWYYVLFIPELSLNEATRKLPAVPTDVVGNAKRCKGDVWPSCLIVGRQYGSPQIIFVHFGYTESLQGYWNGSLAVVNVDGKALDAETNHQKWGDTLIYGESEDKYVRIDPWLKVTIPPTILRSTRLHTRIRAIATIAFEYPRPSGEGFVNRTERRNLHFSIFVVSPSEATTLRALIPQFSALNAILIVLSILIGLSLIPVYIRIPTIRRFIEPIA